MDYLRPFTPESSNERFGVGMLGLTAGAVIFSGGRGGIFSSIKESGLVIAATGAAVMASSYLTPLSRLDQREKAVQNFWRRWQWITLGEPHFLAPDKPFNYGLIGTTGGIATLLFLKFRKSIILKAHFTAKEMTLLNEVTYAGRLMKGSEAALIITKAYPLPGKLFSLIFQTTVLATAASSALLISGCYWKYRNQ